MITINHLLTAILVMFFTASFAQDFNKLDSNGQKHGPWRGLYEESKRIRYEGQFEHGKETGLFKYYDDTKAHPVIATRDFSKGKNSAYTIFYDQKKNIVSEGNVVNKQYHGEWKYYHKNSSAIMTVENYANGKLDGTRTVYYPNGKVAEVTTYKAGVKDGPYKKYAENGVVLEESNYKNNQFHGPTIYREPSGQIAAKGDYKDGGKFGFWEFYNDGKLTKREKYPIVKSKRQDKQKPKEDIKTEVKTAETKG